MTKAGGHLHERQVLMIKAHVEALDAVAAEMEAKWGVGRLPLLVEPTLAARFLAQKEVVNAAVWEKRDPQAVAEACEAMTRAWRYLDGEAERRGAQPLLPAFWETSTPEGTVIVIARDDPSAWAVVRSGRNAVVYTLEEIGRILASQTLLQKAKETFPGGKVVGNRVKATKLDDVLDDEIPF